MMGVKEIDRSLEQWQMGVKDLRRRMILAPTPRERERWYAMLLLGQGCTASDTAKALERDPHTVGRWAAAFGEGGPTALMFEQSGGSPRPRRGATGGFESGSAGAAGRVRNRTGQLELEGGSSVRLGEVLYWPEPKQLPELVTPLGVCPEAAQETLAQG